MLQIQVHIQVRTVRGQAVVQIRGFKSGLLLAELFPEQTWKSNPSFEAVELIGVANWPIELETPNPRNPEIKKGD